MFLLIGSRGYVGSEFARQLTKRNVPFLGINSDFTITVESLTSLIKTRNISFVINAAGYTGKPNVDACELPANKAATLLGNVILPDLIRQACEASGVPFGHVSTGCLYYGGEFSEDDKPNHYSFYSRSKEIAEELLAGSSAYLWRIRMPFNQFNSPRNYLSKILSYRTLITEVNSATHLGEFVQSCLALVEKESPFGVYNIVNPNPLTPEQIISIARKYGLGHSEYNFVPCESLSGVTAKRSNCTLSTLKLNQQGIHLTDTADIIEECFANWESA